MDQQCSAIVKHIIKCFSSLPLSLTYRAFPVTAAKIWNALPPAITSLPSLGAFKRALKTELFRRSYGNANYRPQHH